MFVDDEILNRLAAKTTQYTEPKTDAKPTMHMKFK